MSTNTDIRCKLRWLETDSLVPSCPFYGVPQSRFVGSRQLACTPIICLTLPEVDALTKASETMPGTEDNGSRTLSTTTK